MTKGERASKIPHFDDIIYGSPLFVVRFAPALSSFPAIDRMHHFRGDSSRPTLFFTPVSPRPSTLLTNIVLAESRQSVVGNRVTNRKGEGGGGAIIIIVNDDEQQISLLSRDLRRLLEESVVRARPSKLCSHSANSRWDAVPGAMRVPLQVIQG